MTTIAVSRPLMLMAADGAMTVNGRKHISDPKMFRTAEYICGIAGASDAIAKFRQWLREPKAGRLPQGQWEAILLMRDGTINWYGPDDMLVIQEDYFAIGTGAHYAVSAMDAQNMLGLPADPRIAVRVACVRDGNSSEPVQTLRWKNARTQKGE